jgi:hypothetical protein
VASALLIVATYTGALTFFGQPLAPEFVILARVVGWGGVGGVIGALYNMPWFFQYREYDPAYNASYFARPLQGLIIGGILFLVVEAGMMAGNVINPLLGTSTSSGELPVGPWFLYAFAALAGFKQEYVYQFFDDVMRAIFRLPKLPEQFDVPTPPAKNKKT